MHAGSEGKKINWFETPRACECVLLCYVVQSGVSSPVLVRLPVRLVDRQLHIAP